MQVHVVNRDADADGLARFGAAARAHAVAFRRVPAFDAQGFPFGYSGRLREWLSPNGPDPRHANPVAKTPEEPHSLT